jgi:hypothetical protein
MTGLYADAMLQLWKSDYKLAVNLRLGGGFTNISNIKFSNKDGSHSENVSTTLFSLNAGAAVQWFVWKSWFIEGGLDFIQYICQGVK